MDNDIIIFGKYKKYTYIEVFEKDFNYCEWILNLKNKVKNTETLKFQKYLYLKKSIKNIEENNYIDCIICNENTNLYKRLNCCNNNLCNMCLIKINNFFCPFCRSDIEEMIDRYTKEIKKYIIEKDKKLNEQEYLTNIYIDKYIKIYNKNKGIVEFLEDLILLKNINKKEIVKILNEYIKTIK